jgi:hypothetical protein
VISSSAEDKEMAEKLEQKERITIYAGQEERQELLRKVLQYTRADSLSEAIFKALAELMEYKEEQWKAEGAKALEESQGLWAGDPEIERAFELIARGWEDWQIEEY